MTLRPSDHERQRQLENTIRSQSPDLKHYSPNLHYPLRVKGYTGNPKHEQLTHLQLEIKRYGIWNMT